MSETPKRKRSPITLEDIFNQNAANKQDIMNKFDGLAKNIAEVTKTVSMVEDRVCELENEITTLKKKLGKIEKRSNVTEQFSKRKCMEIKGVEEKELRSVTNMKEYVVSLCQKFKIKCDESQIEKAYKLKINSSRLQLNLIIVWFYDENLKASIMKQKTEYEKGSKAKSGIFFSHTLTSFNRALLNKAIEVKNDVNMPIVYVSNGKIVMKAHYKGKKNIISSFEDIGELLLKANQLSLSEK